MSGCVQRKVDCRTMTSWVFSTPVGTRLDTILMMKRRVLREFKEEDWSAVLTYQSDPLYN